ncbi:glutamate racemase [Candidatus Saccharibacteria bacterium]|nr:glutamate racemase [Candidatus Saccharibacteria bacterium]
MKIGVFDSGVGGLSVAGAIQKALPEHEIVLREDKANLPYGTKSPEQLLVLVMPIMQGMAAEGCKVIVVACNTVTTSIIEELRTHVAVPLLGMEPMVQPASMLTKTGTIAVFATPTTLRSTRYNWLKSIYCENIAVIEPDCSTWSKMVEDAVVDRKQIEKNVQEALDSNADVIVLGCTHYHWIEDLIKEIANNKAEVIQPEQPVIAELKRVLAQLS